MKVTYVQGTRTYVRVMEVQHLRGVPPAISHPRCLSDLTLVLAMPPSLEAPPPQPNARYFGALSRSRAAKWSS